MEKQVWRLFPTLVTYYKQVLSPEQLAAALAYCLTAATGEHGAFVNDAKSSFSTSSRLIDDLERSQPVLAGLKKGLTELVTEYAAALGFDRVSITNSWCNVQRPGSVLKHHVHTEARVSAALCIQADEMSSRLYLENPNPMLNFIRPDRYTEATFELAKFQLSPGDLILFPSWIKHGSGFEANQSDLRVVISLNAA